MATYCGASHRHGNGRPCPTTANPILIGNNQERRWQAIEFANDIKGKRTSIYNALPKEKYYCPCCGEEMTQKKGQLVVWHYAHKSLENCVSYYDNKGAWHREMQELFPEKNREVFNGEFGRHFFDVLTDNGRIIEFQHSPIDKWLFNKRTQAYLHYAETHGSRCPVWVFDYTERTTFIHSANSFYSAQRMNLYRKLNLFENYSSRGYYDKVGIFHARTGYELWIRVKPQNACLTQYMKVDRVYGNNSYYGEPYTETDFKKYLEEQ